MDRAKNLIDEFCLHEYGLCADFSDLTKIAIAYTTLTDDEIPIQVCVDLENYCIHRWLSETPLEPWQHSSLESLVNDTLEYLDFQDLIFVSERELASLATLDLFSLRQENHLLSTAK